MSSPSPLLVAIPAPQEPSVGQTINSSFRVGLGMAGLYGAGLVYGAVCRIDRIVTARAFAIAIGVKMLFDEISRHFLHSAMSAKNYAATRLAGNAAFFTITIAAFRYLNVVGNLGTAFMSFSAVILLIGDISRYTKA